MRDWKQVRIDAAIDVFFCDPHAPWQRGSNENTNGLLRQYFPKGTDFATVTAAQLDTVADELNDRPRKRFAFAHPQNRSQSYCCNNRQHPPNRYRDPSPPGPLHGVSMLVDGRNYGAGARRCAPRLAREVHRPRRLKRESEAADPKIRGLSFNVLARDCRPSGHPG
jgi:hypothetical protein